MVLQLTELTIPLHQLVLTLSQRGFEIGVLLQQGGYVLSLVNIAGLDRADVVLENHLQCRSGDGSTR